MQNHRAGRAVGFAKSGAGPDRMPCARERVPTPQCEAARGSRVDLGGFLQSVFPPALLRAGRSAPNRSPFLQALLENRVLKEWMDWGSSHPQSAYFDPKFHHLT